MIYRQPEHYREIVERCPNHITNHKDGEIFVIIKLIVVANLDTEQTNRNPMKEMSMKMLTTVSHASPRKHFSQVHLIMNS